MKNTFKEKNGITLIALIITVIILLILAGTAISISINGGDIFGKTNQARENWNIAVAEENTIINNYVKYLEQYSEGNGGETIVQDEEHPWGSMATEEEVIPQLFEYYIIEHATGKLDEEEGVYKVGRVADADGNIRISDNGRMGKVSIAALNYDFILKDVPGYVPGSTGSGIERTLLMSAIEKYTSKLVIPKTVRLIETEIDDGNGGIRYSCKYDATGDLYEVVEVGFLTKNTAQNDVFITDPYYGWGEEVPIRAEMKVVIPYGVKRVNESAFAYCVGLSEVYIPDSCENIDGYAFKGCSSLETVRLPHTEGLCISSCAFWDCKSLQSLEIPEGIIILNNILSRL